MHNNEEYTTLVFQQGTKSFSVCQVHTAAGMPCGSPSTICILRPPSAWTVCKINIFSLLCPPIPMERSHPTILPTPPFPSRAVNKKYHSAVLHDLQFTCNLHIPTDWEWKRDSVRWMPRMVSYGVCWHWQWVTFCILVLYFLQIIATSSWF